MSIREPPWLPLLFELVDLEIVAEYGDFLGGPPACGRERVWVCDRAAASRNRGVEHGSRTGRSARAVFADNTGARGLCLHVLRIPPGGRAKAHLHASHETAIYLMEGAVSVLHGQGLRHRTEMASGDYLYIPADCPHVPVNWGSIEAFAVLARTDPNEQESVVLLPSMEDVIADRLA